MATLKDLRKAHSLTQVELSKRSGILQQTISAIESGLTKGITMVVYESLSAVVGDFEMGGSEVEPKPKETKQLSKRKQVEKPISKEEELDGLRNLW